MKKQSSFKTSKTDWTRLRSVKDKDVVLTRDHTEVDLRHIGVARRGIRPVAPKASISLRVNADVLAWFRAQGRG